MKKFNRSTAKLAARVIPAVLAAGLMFSSLAVSAESIEQEQDTEASEESLTGTLPNGETTYNLLLIGSDRRDDSWNGNSDVMIVATINQEKETLFLTSFMRDLYADIPGYGIHKLNYAYAVSGAETLEATLEDNYQLEIDNYAVVDFETMADVVDTIGGVEVELNEDEIEVLNNYLTSMNAEEDYMSGAGTYVLNGHQAVAYMRIRYVGNNDYERTQRQRNVLSSIFESMQEQSASELTNLANEILPNIEHDIDPIGLIQLIAMLPEISQYELVENRIPYDDLYDVDGEMLVPDFAATRERLLDTLYGDSEQE